MTFLTDNEQKKYFFHIVLILTGATLLAGILWRANGQEMKKAFLEHDGSAVSSLLEQGVSETVIARAFSEKTVTENGSSSAHGYRRGYGALFPAPDQRFAQRYGPWACGAFALFVGEPFAFVRPFSFPEGKAL